MGCPQRRALRGGAAEDRDATKHHDGAEESARAKVTCAQRLRRAERRAAPSFDGAADGGCADPEGTLKGVALTPPPHRQEQPSGSSCPGARSDAKMTSPRPAVSSGRAAPAARARRWAPWRRRPRSREFLYAPEIVPGDWPPLACA